MARLYNDPVPDDFDTDDKDQLPPAGYTLSDEWKFAVKDLSAAIRHSRWPDSFESHGKVVKTDQGRGTPAIITDSNGVNYYATCFGNVNLFGDDGVKFGLNRFSTGKASGLGEYKLNLQVPTGTGPVAFTGPATRKRMAQALATLNAKKPKMEESDNPEATETEGEETMVEEAMGEETTVQDTPSKTQSKLKGATKGKGMAGSRKTRKPAKKDDITITPMKSDTPTNVLGAKSMLDNSSPLTDSASKRIGSASKKTKPDPSMFDPISSGSDEPPPKAKDNTGDLQRQLDQSVQEISRLKHKVQHSMALARNLTSVLSTSTTGYLRVVDAIPTARSDVVNQTMEKLEKKFDDFQGRYQLDLTPIVEDGAVKPGEGIKLLLTLGEDLLDTLAKRLEGKMETDRKVKKEE
ncbi:MAG: hypothetical protein HETSPECPRED_005274 [Heterodermia speciosa]|uniref:Uncharacterized protein n=1 Tax=Heterodermia speciosa TaxID=116794 RepID=A0A8H3PJY9_9LECA|nr:MAG: hypothetical protein HETSPECPRED_005274 [Heterodermia speciosa]